MSLYLKTLPYINYVLNLAGNFSWQLQVLLGLLVVGGGYIAFVNSWPPFNRGGVGDQLRGLLPKTQSEEETVPPEQKGSTPPFGPVVNDPTIDPNSPLLPNAPGAGPNPPLMGGTGPRAPNQTYPLPPFQSSIQSDPSLTDYSVYQNYANQLQAIFGPLNKPNMGQGSGIVTVGDPNLGTT